MMQRTKRPFASVAQLVLVILLLVSLVMMGQQSSHVVYQVGLIVLIGATFAQIAFGNIPPDLCPDRVWQYSTRGWLWSLYAAVHPLYGHHRRALCREYIGRAATDLVGSINRCRAASTIYRFHQRQPLLVLCSYE